MTLGGNFKLTELHKIEVVAGRKPLNFTFDGSATLTAKAISYHKYYDVGEEWYFNVANDQPVVRFTANSEPIGTNGKNYAKIKVTTPDGWQKKYPAGVTVPLFVGDGTFGVPSKWASADASLVTLGEGVSSFIYDSTAGRSSRRRTA